MGVKHSLGSMVVITLKWRVNMTYLISFCVGVSFINAAIYVVNRNPGAALGWLSCAVCTAGAYIS